MGDSNRPAAPRQQCADAVLMVRPVSFGFNPETAKTNTFQRPPEGKDADAATRARNEFQGLAKALASEGVAVAIAEDSSVPKKPDAVFPNNWLSFHPCGTLVLYPMAHMSRRVERRQEVIDTAIEELDFRVQHLLDLTYYEDEQKYLEGTGSLVLDHIGRVAYACVSPRTHAGVVAEWGRELGYETVTFAAASAEGVPLYHTNVLMCIGERCVVVASAAIAAADRARVLERLKASGRDVIEIGHAELNQFAGNMLELSTWDEALGDSRLIVMSESARRALKPETFARLSGSTDSVLVAPVPTIEKYGGGSVRCMLAEVFTAP
jgi:hypothetical protein